MVRIPTPSGRGERQEPDYYHSDRMRKLRILPTTNKYDAVALHQTNGCNYDVGPGYVIEWLKKLELK